MKTTSVVQPRLHSTNSIKLEAQQSFSVEAKSSALSSPVDVWSFQEKTYRVPEGEFPQALSDFFRESGVLPRPQFPQRYDEKKFSIYEQPIDSTSSPVQWMALVEHERKLIARVVADGDDYRIHLLNPAKASSLISKEELMEVIEGAKDELELGKYLPAEK